MTRFEMKSAAKERLGNKIFNNTWLYAVLIMFVFSALETAAGAIIVGAGLLVLTGPMSYGRAFVFLRNARDGSQPDISDLFRGFRDDLGGTMLLGLMSSIFITLWSLLLIIPGAVKTYAYSFAYYLKIDHPEYDWRTCLHESERLMKGHKWDLFVLDLSFIGWEIVGSLCLGVGTFWVSAWRQAANAQFYQSVIYSPCALNEAEQ